MKKRFSSPSDCCSGELAFRRQFVLGSDESMMPATWNRQAVSSRLHASIHPDLPATRAGHGDRTLLLLGYLLDPDRPERRDGDILTELVASNHDIDDLVAATDRLSGRWVLVFAKGDHAVVFHDAVGMRQVHHVRASDGSTWCASRPCLLASLLDLDHDRTCFEQLDRDGVFGSHVNHFWPGDRSSIVGVQRLLPNHYLEMGSGIVKRYWPRNALTAQPPATAVPRCSKILTGTVDAASRRFNLSVALTAGLDSRIVLAACRSRANRLDYYTVKRPSLHDGSPDLRIPRRIARDFELRHRVVKAPTHPDPALHDVIASTSVPVHPSVVLECSAVREAKPADGRSWMTLNGNVNEVARVFYPRLSPTAVAMAHAAGMGRSDYAAERFGEWYEAARPALADSGIDAWDLFYWEQKLGGWFGGIRTEFDMVEDVVTPFNCRALLATMLGVDEALRSGPAYRFHRDLIMQMWPELLRYPVNPPDYRLLTRWWLDRKRDEVLGVAGTIARNLGIYPLYESAKRRRRSRSGAA